MAKPRRFPLLLVLIFAGVLAVGLWAFVFRPESEDPVEAIPTAVVERGRLRVTVLEGGSLEALESHTVTSKVEGQAAILYIVEEGVVLTSRSPWARVVILAGFPPSSTVQVRIDGDSSERVADAGGRVRLEWKDEAPHEVAVTIAGN